MKLLKNRAFAVLVLVAAIALSSLYGLSQKPPVEVHEGAIPLDTSLPTGYFESFIADEANIFSSSTERSIALYNANWKKMVNGVLGVVAAQNMGSDLETVAYDWADRMGLDGNDSILLIDIGTRTVKTVGNGILYDAINSQPDSFEVSYLYDGAQKGDYNQAVLNLFGQIHLLVSDGSYQEDAFFTGGGFGVFNVISALIPAILLIVVLVVLFNLIDGIRYSSWYGRYGTTPVPPVVYRPIFWWHRPGSRWYRRRRTPPPPPPPRGPGGPGGFGGGPRPPMGGGPRSPRPPMGGSGPRPPMGGGKRPPVGGGSRPTPPRSGSFGGGSRGGSFGSGRSGSFGGGSRRGGFGGGSRGGSFGGGSRGGSFGGRR